MAPPQVCAHLSGCDLGWSILISTPIDSDLEAFGFIPTLGGRGLARRPPSRDCHRYHYSHAPRPGSLLTLLLAAAAQAQTIVWDKFDPMAVGTNRTAVVVLEAQTSGTVAGMRLGRRLSIRAKRPEIPQARRRSSDRLDVRFNIDRRLKCDRS